MSELHLRFYFYFFELCLENEFENPFNFGSVQYLRDDFLLFLTPNRSLKRFCFVEYFYYIFRGIFSFFFQARDIF